MKIKYYYDTETCKYERIKTTRSDLVINTLGVLAICLVMAVGLVLAFNYYFESPKEMSLRNEVSEMQYYYENLQEDVDKMASVLMELENRDDKVYRAVLGAEPIDQSIRDAGIGGADRYRDIKEKSLSHEELIVSLSEKIDHLKRKLYIESKSLDEVVSLTIDKEKMVAAIPAVRPIATEDLYSLASGYGMRIHPIYKIRKMHRGVDFSASRGTPIYATADGVVTRAKTSFSGYGKMVEIDHGFGYKTRYAHMHGFSVKRRQKVRRGDLIGYVGSTGLATAPHVHYEILINGKHVNPVYYMVSDISAEDYRKIIELASIENQSLGM